MGSTSNVGPRGGQKQRLGAGVISFIIIDVVLVVVAALMVFGVIGPLASGSASIGHGLPSAPADGSGVAGRKPSGTPTALPDSGPSTPDVPAGTELFASPSKNITCTMADDSARCEIVSLIDKPKKSVGCDQRVGYVAVLDTEGVETPCEKAPSAATGEIRTLTYGETVTVGNFTCASTKEGMKCSDRTAGRGFVIARAGIRSF